MKIIGLDLENRLILVSAYHRVPNPEIRGVQQELHKMLNPVLGSFYLWHEESRKQPDGSTIHSFKVTR